MTAPKPGFPGRTSTPLLDCFLAGSARPGMKAEVQAILSALAGYDRLDEDTLQREQPSLLARIRACSPAGLDLFRLLRGEAPASTTHSRQNVSASLRHVRRQTGRAPAVADYPPGHVVPVLATVFWGSIEAWGAGASDRVQRPKNHWLQPENQRVALLEAAARHPGLPLTHALLLRAGFGGLAHAITAAELTALAAELGLDRGLAYRPAGFWDKPQCIQRYAELCCTKGVTLSSHALTQLGGEGCTLRAQAARHWGGFRAFQREAVAGHPHLSPPRSCVAKDGTRLDSWNEVLAYNVIRRALPGVPVSVHVRLPDGSRYSCDLVVDGLVYVEVLGVSLANMTQGRNAYERRYAERWAAKATVYAACGIEPVLIEPADVADGQRLAGRVAVIAKRLGLAGTAVPVSSSRSVRANGTWTFEFLCQVVAEVAAAVGGWPTHADLIARDYTTAAGLLRQRGMAERVSAAINVPLRNRKRAWTEARMIEAVAAWAREHGRYPTDPDLRASGLGPVALARARVFHGRQDELHGAVERRCGQGLPRRQVPKGSYGTPAKLAALLRPLCDRLGRFPTGEEIRADLPATVYERVCRFGGMRAMAACMGVAFEGPRRWDRATVLAALRARLPRVLDLLSGGRPRLVATTASVIATMGPGGMNVVVRHFGTIAGLRRALAQDDASATAARPEDGKEAA
ncbi:MAG: hypothetical protein ACRYHQ_20180 [Janthinobacterium lividum]